MSQTASQMRAEQAKNYAFQRIFQNQTASGKDRQRYPLYTTVFWFRLACILQKTVRNTVKLSATNRFKLAQRLSYYLSISISYAVSLPDLTMHLATVAVFISD
jgi:hypothetical protein